MAKLFCSLMLFLLSNLVSLQGQVYFQAGEEEDGFRFGNKYLERIFELKDGVWRTAWLVNKLTGHTWRVDSDEFRIRFTYERLGYWPGQENPQVVRADDCIFRGYSIEEPKGGKRKLILSYLWKGQGEEWAVGAEGRWQSMEIEVTYTLEDTLPWMRKSLTVKSPGGKFYFVEELAVERMSIAGAETLHQGFGQPVYTGEMFFGLEYPAGNNLMKDNCLDLYYYPGELIGPEGLEKKYSAVWGVAPQGRTRAAFLKYVDKIRATPVRPFLLYNTWYDLRTSERFEGTKGDLMNEENCLARIRSFKENLVDKGIELNSFVLDEGWDKYTPFWEVNTRIFPGGLEKLDKALKGIGSSLGLWFGPIGGYGEGLRLRSEGGRKAGLEVSHKGYLDLAGPKYNKIFKDRLLEYTRRFGINYYKFDGVQYGYGDTDHGILPGIYSREAQTAALAAILDTLHAVKPDIFLNVTTSQWLSPWWLMHADCVFMGGGDFGWLSSLPAVSRRDQAISYRDKICYDDFQRFKFQFPTSSIMTVGIIKGEYEYLGTPDETVDKWNNDLVMHFSRGLMMWELYISPEVLSAAEWESLRASILWAKADSRVLLANTTMVGGDPEKREVYGYFHYGPEKMILILRNPYIEPVSFSMPLYYEHGWLEPDSGTYLPVTVYPCRAVEGPWLSYGEKFEAVLEGYETKVIELVRRDKVDFPIVRGAGFEFADEALALYLEDSSRGITAENPTVKEINIFGTKVPPGMEVPLKLELSSLAGRLEVTDSRSEEWKSAGPAGLKGKISLSLPSGIASVEAAFLIELDSGLKGVKPSVRDNGNLLACRTETGEDGRWYWFIGSIDPKSAHTLNYEFYAESSSALPIKGTLSLWLIAHRELEKKIIQIPGFKPRLSGEQALPHDSRLRRRVECLFKRPVRF